VLASAVATGQIVMPGPEMVTVLSTNNSPLVRKIVLVTAKLMVFSVVRIGQRPTQ
jgi:hypothetical protein